MSATTMTRYGAAAAAAVAAPFAGSVPVLDPAAALETTAGVAIVHLTAWTLELAERLSRHALAHPVRLVPVREDGALTVIGPVLEPSARACLSCVEYRRLATAGGRVPWQSPRLALGGTGTPAMAEAVLLLAAALLEPAPGIAESGPVAGAGAGASGA
ncbi:hypothetical protein AB0D97_37055 [Streptomyces roseus]|uniref:hypothetical protein n=1 Tax=Streptomyces roseus TaxID=66430 RepID=UPI0033D267C4